jgi:hypothetical protein
MKCINCQAEIDPKWVHCITLNNCPACGKEIMDNSSIDLLNELRTAISVMSQSDTEVFVQGLAGWLLSNYHMEKIGTGEPTEFFTPKKPKIQQETSEVVNKQGLKVASNPLQQFYKNAGVDAGRVSKLKNLVQEINGVDEHSELDVEEDDNILPAEVKYPEYTKQVLDAMVNKNDEHKVVSKQHFDDENDVDDLPPALQQDRLRRLEKQQAVGSVGIGKIRRTD